MNFPIKSIWDSVHLCTFRLLPENFGELPTIYIYIYSYTTQLFFSLLEVDLLDRGSAYFK